MSQEENCQCVYCMKGKCYANAAVSPEEYDAYLPKCHNCKLIIVKKA